jgi:thymidine kinase
MGVHHIFGRKELIYGTMASGKSLELIRRLKKFDRFAKKFGYAIKVFKPLLDTRQLEDGNPARHIASRVGITYAEEVVAVAESKEILQHMRSAPKSIVAVEEVHFFDGDIVEVTEMLTQKGHHVILVGLDYDFRGEFFPLRCRSRTMKHVIDFFDADEKTYLMAICQECGRDAEFPQRIINGLPAKYYDPLILVGDEEYQPRCKEHFFCPGKEETQLITLLVAKHKACIPIAALLEVTRVTKEEFDAILKMLIEEKLVEVKDDVVCPV